MLSVNSKAPDFSAPDQTGKVHKLSDYSGRWVILYFYPKDETLGCTKEACSFRDNLADFTKMGVVVLGVSKDSVESHKKFSKHHNLNFPILSDVDKKIINDYGVWKLKKFLGREYFGVARTTFLIDPAGKIRKIYEKVNPLGHINQIIDDLRNLRSGN